MEYIDNVHVCITK